MSKAKEHLRALLELSRRQAIALADDDLTEFDRLTAEREALTAEIQSMRWVDKRDAESLAREILAADEGHLLLLRQRSAAVAKQIAETRRYERVLHRYGQSTQVNPDESSFVDRSA